MLPFLTPHERAELDRLLATSRTPLPHNFDRRDYQEGFWRALVEERRRRLVWVMHRRGGKDLTCWNGVITPRGSDRGAPRHADPWGRGRHPRAALAGPETDRIVRGRTAAGDAASRLALPARPVWLAPTAGGYPSVPEQRQGRGLTIS